MSGLRVLGLLFKAAVIAYVASGVAYWLTCEVWLRLVGKEITFSPPVSVILAVPFWPVNVYADLKWIGLMPQDIAAILVLLISVPLLLRKYGILHTSQS
jgi:hypothetical protein